MRVPSHFLQYIFLFVLVHNSEFVENLINNYCTRPHLMWSSAQWVKGIDSEAFYSIITMQRMLLCIVLHHGCSSGPFSRKLLWQTDSERITPVYDKCSQPITCSDFSSLYQTLSLAIDLKLHVNPGPSKNDGTLYHWTQRRRLYHGHTFA